MTQRTIAAHLASRAQARINCIAAGNTEWKMRYEERIADIERNHLPHGAGIDNGVKVNLDASNGDKVVLNVSFHTMNKHGYYDGWRDYIVTVTPAFDGVNVRITGRDYNGGLKDYLADLFSDLLTKVIDI